MSLKKHSHCCPQAVLIGSDCPDITPGVLTTALVVLESFDVGTDRPPMLPMTCCSQSKLFLPKTSPV